MQFVSKNKLVWQHDVEADAGDGSGKQNLRDAHDILYLQRLLLQLQRRVCVDLNGVQRAEPDRNREYDKQPRDENKQHDWVW